jgi:hypothetical protein
VLKLRAIDLDDGVRVSKENLRCGFDHPCFAGTSRSQEKERSKRFVALVHSGEEQLIQIAHTANGILLTDNERRKPFVEFLSLRTFEFGIEKEGVVRYLLSLYFRNHDVSPL